MRRGRRRLENPSPSERRDSAAGGFRFKPTQVVVTAPNPPRSLPPCPKRDAIFIERGAALGGMKNSYENRSSLVTPPGQMDGSPEKRRHRQAGLVRSPSAGREASSLN